MAPLLRRVNSSTFPRLRRASFQAGSLVSVLLLTGCSVNVGLPKGLQASSSAASPSSRQSEGETLYKEAQAYFQRIEAPNADLAKLQTEVDALEAKYTADKQRYAARGHELEQTFKGLDHAIQQTQVKRRTQAVLDSAVVKRLPQFKAEDAIDLKKVAEAFAATEPSHFVHTLDSGGNPGTDRRRYQPSLKEVRTNRTMVVRGTYPRKHDGYVALTAIAGRTRGGPTLETLYGQTPGDLPAGVPGLVWNVIADHLVILVTADGGRYTAYTTSLGMGVPENPVLGEPKHVPFMWEDMEEFGKAGVIPARLVEQLEDARKKGEECAAKVLAAHEPKYQEIHGSNALPSVRQNRINQLNEKVEQEYVGKCAAHLKAFETAWYTAIEQRLAERKALLQAVEPRVTAAAARK